MLRSGDRATAQRTWHGWRLQGHAYPTLGNVDFEAGAAILLAAQVAGVPSGFAAEAASPGQHARAPDAPLRQGLARISVVLHGLICEGTIAAGAAREAGLEAVQMTPISLCPRWCEHEPAI